MRFHTRFGFDLRPSLSVFAGSWLCEAKNERTTGQGRLDRVRTLAPVDAECLTAAAAVAQVVAAGLRL